MLQFLYTETEAAAAEIVDAVAPATDEVTKEDIATAAADKAEEIADAVAEASEAEGAEFTEEMYNEVLGTAAQVIYTEVMAEIATQQACYAMESMFSDEVVEEFYAAQDVAAQEEYGEKWNKVKAHFKNNGRLYADAAAGTAGAAGGAYVGARIARKRGASVKKGAIIGALVGAGAGVGAHEVGRATSRAILGRKNASGFGGRIKHAFGGGRKLAYKG